MLHRYKLEWTARNFVVAHTGHGAVTTCGGECWVSAETEQGAIESLRRLPELAFARVKVIA